MATEEEISQLWNSFPKKLKQEEAIVRLYRLAEKEGRQAGMSAMEKELLSDATIEAALQAFGFGRHKRDSVKRAGIITQRAVLREAIRIAIEKMKK